MIILVNRHVKPTILPISMPGFLPRAVLILTDHILNLRYTPGIAYVHRNRVELDCGYDHISIGSRARLHHSENANNIVIYLYQTIVPNTTVC